MDGGRFVQELIAENASIMGRLAPADTLRAESGGDLNPRSLLRIALRNELEAAEIAALWVPKTRDANLKIALARQSGDEAKHYRLIEDRLRDLGDNLAGFDPLAAGYSPMFKFLAAIETDVERVAAGQFTREAIALVKNAQFIELCEHAGDAATARLYRETIQPDEKFHHELGVKFLTQLATDDESQRLARAARIRTIELAEELQTLAFNRAGLHHAPGC
ncbi:MAG TPA: ferritin-like domain-containing protein [Candidatus Binataceae bacterium]|nr:ferritin-like domain-containing protein [Candidatus Binataceae bacterium]